MTPEAVQGLTQAGALGVVVLILFWRDAKKDEKLDRVVEAINHLTRAITLEVLTRPQIVQKAKDEAQELSDLTNKK